MAVTTKAARQATCDRCGRVQVYEVQPHSGNDVPEGWIRMSFFLSSHTSVLKDICAHCWHEYDLWILNGPSNRPELPPGHSIVMFTS